jgi:hypothetical protein
MSENLNNINNKLVEILSPEKGYFGRISTFGMRPGKYEYIGYELSENFLTTLEKMTEEERKKLVRLIMYFEIHSVPLRRLLEVDEVNGLHNFYSETAWSHFMTLVMFGMLEYAVKNTPLAKFKTDKDRENGYINKFASILNFLENNLPASIKEKVAKRYKKSENVGVSSFEEVIKHMWNDIRSGFVHEIGIESKGMNWETLRGIGTKENPIILGHDVPMQEFLQITWQAILNCFGYTGTVELPRLDKLPKNTKVNSFLTR